MTRLKLSKDWLIFPKDNFKLLRVLQLRPYDTQDEVLHQIEPHFFDQFKDLVVNFEKLMHSYVKIDERLYFFARKRYGGACLERYFYQ